MGNWNVNLRAIAAALSILTLVSCSNMGVDRAATDEADLTPSCWTVGAPLLLPGEQGSFDEVAVKDPSIVYHDGMWHLFYTARGREEYSIGYVSAEKLEGLQTSRRSQLANLGGTKDRYAAAPQVFFFEPQGTWYLIYQTRDENYQPVYSTTRTIDKPGSWSEPSPLAEKHDRAKWIDFWVICDDTTAYLFFTRGHRDVYVMTTRIRDFPRGFGNVRKTFSPVHEAVHIYKGKGRGEFHMFYETRTADGVRGYGLATARHLLGPWSRVTDDFATGDRLRYQDHSEKWTEEVSHGEMIRSAYNQKMEYDPSNPRFLIQGLLSIEHTGTYPDLPWKLGIIAQN